jgi:hypothetical protein
VQPTLFSRNTLQSSEQGLGYKHGQEILKSRLEQWHSSVQLDDGRSSGIVSQEWSQSSRYADQRGAAGYLAQAKTGREKQIRLIATAKDNAICLKLLMAC